MQYLAAGAGVRRDVGRTAYLSFWSSVRYSITAIFGLLSCPSDRSCPGPVLPRIARGKEAIGAMPCPYISPSRVAVCGWPAPGESLHSGKTGSWVPATAITGPLLRWPHWSHAAMETETLTKATRDGGRGALSNGGHPGRGEIRPCALRDCGLWVCGLRSAVCALAVCGMAEMTIVTEAVMKLISTAIIQ